MNAARAAPRPVISVLVAVGLGPASPSSFEGSRMMSSSDYDDAVEGTRTAFMIK